MPLVLVTYDPDKEPTSNEYQGVMGVIKSEKDWARLSESSHAMNTQMTPLQVYEKITPHLDKNDSLLVITLRRPHCG